MLLVRTALTFFMVPYLALGEIEVTIGRKILNGLRGRPRK